MSDDLALVLFSGGQDSTTCLFWALEHFTHVETVGFSYGQRHHTELAARKTIREAIQHQFPKWKTHLKDDHMIDLSIIAQLSDTALTKEAEITFLENGLPNTFVPGRNLFFFIAAATLAYRRNITTLIGGMCETDFSGYPDCKSSTLKALEHTLRLGMDYPFKIVTPLMDKNKAQTWHMVFELGGEALVELVRNETRTCYLGEQTTLHPWGYGCGICPSCQLRKKGFEQYQQTKIHP